MTGLAGGDGGLTGGGDWNDVICTVWMNGRTMFHVFFRDVDPSARPVSGLEDENVVRAWYEPGSLPHHIGKKFLQ